MIVKEDFARTYFLKAFPRASASREEPVPRSRMHHSCWNALPGAPSITSPVGLKEAHAYSLGSPHIWRARLAGAPLAPHVQGSSLLSNGGHAHKCVENWQKVPGMKHSMPVFWGAGHSLPHCVQPQAVRKDAPWAGGGAPLQPSFISNWILAAALWGN